MSVGHQGLVPVDTLPLESILRENLNRARAAAEPDADGYTDAAAVEAADAAEQAIIDHEDAHGLVGTEYAPR
jgi:hypothetical protein